MISVFDVLQDTTLPPQIWILIGLGGGLLLLIWFATSKSSGGSLNIKSKVVGDGQHGTARWASPKEISQTYSRVVFKVAEWRQGKDLPTVHGLILGSTGKKGKVTALIDSDDVHCLMIGASGVGKTAFFLYPNLEFSCASGMSFLALDTKGGATRS